MRSLIFALFFIVATYADALSLDWEIQYRIVVPSDKGSEYCVNHMHLENMQMNFSFSLSSRNHIIGNTHRNFAKFGSTIEGTMIDSWSGDYDELIQMKITAASNCWMYHTTNINVKISGTLNGTDISEVVMIPLERNPDAVRGIATINWKIQKASKMKELKGRDPSFAKIQYEMNPNHFRKLVENFYDQYPKSPGEGAITKDEFETSAEFKVRSDEFAQKFANKINQYCKCLERGSFVGIPVEIGRYNADDQEFIFEYTFFVGTLVYLHGVPRDEDIRDNPYYFILTTDNKLEGVSASLRKGREDVHYNPNSNTRVHVQSSYLLEGQIGFKMITPGAQAKVLRQESGPLFLEIDYIPSCSSRSDISPIDHLRGWKYNIRIHVVAVRLVDSDGNILHEF